MSIKYIYAPRKRSELINFNLSNNREIIENVLNHLFSENLKDFYVFQNYFEFTLHISTDAKILRKMGHSLSNDLGYSYHFRRKPERMYAIASRNDNYINIELLDFDLCKMDADALRKRIHRANMYKEVAGEWANRMSYVDIYSTQLTLEEFEKCFGEPWNPQNEGEECLYNVDLVHRRVEGRIDDQQKKDGFFVIEHLFTGDEHYMEYDDIVKIVQSHPCSQDKEILERIDNLISLEDKDILTVDPAELKTVLPEGTQSYTFTVHNVGQGLATSLARDNQCVFYFDYGMAYGRNKRTGPQQIDLSIAHQAVIVLSHIDEDHWCGYRVNANALQATWIIPKQKLEKKFKVLLGHIIYAGGRILFHKGIQYNNLEIGHIDHSNIQPSRQHRKKTLKHETGYAMYLHGNDEKGNDRYIVVSGDQDYDYQDSNNLRNINLLVACHHGGAYSWSTKVKPPAPANQNSLVVYSYGEGNSYGHPTRRMDYINNGWCTQFDTPGSMGYKETIDITL